MLQLGIMIAIAAALFWWLPLGVAFVGGIVILFLAAAKLRKAVKRGRRLLLARDEDDEARRIRDRDATLLYAMWIGLTISGGAHDGAYMGHHDGGFGGDMGGGFDGGGGGDGGM